MVKHNLILWDLDGTLIDSRHRAFCPDKQDFDLDYWIKHSTWEYIQKDKILPLIAFYHRFRDIGFTQVAVTAREMTAADFRYLDENGLIFEDILHRGSSKELDHDLKDAHLHKYLNEKEYTRLYAFDDKEENLKVFNDHGFESFNARKLNNLMSTFWGS